MPANSRLAMINAFIVQSWNAESLEFREAFEEEATKEYQAQMAEFNHTKDFTDPSPLVKAE